MKEKSSVKVEVFPLILQPPVKLFLKAVKWVSQQQISFTRPVKPTGSPPVCSGDYG
jgi:hypothetical protein